MRSFGCVLHPIKKNKNKKLQKKHISRMAPDDFFLQNELSIYKFIQNSNFFIFETAEPITYNSLEENEFNDASNMLEKSNYFLLRYPFKTLYTFEEKLNTLKNTHYIQFIMNSYKKLLYSIDTLNKQSIIHNNISYETICVDDKMEVLICKFGLSMHLIKKNETVDYIKPYLQVYNTKYESWPQEFHILSYMLSNKMESVSKINIETIMTDISNNFYKKEANDYFIKYMNKPISYIISDMLLYKNTWDQYALSILFLDILSGLPEKNVFIQNFRNLLLDNIRPNPQLRLTIHDTLHQFEKLCFETDISVFKELFIMN